MLNWAFLFTVKRDTQKLHKSQQKLYLVSIHSQRTNKQLFTVKVKVSNTVTERSIHRVLGLTLRHFFALSSKC